MNSVGIDLHKKTIVLCVRNQDRKVVHRKTFACCQAEAVRASFRGLGPFRAVVEATARSEGLVALLEPLAGKVVLAHPGKLRVIAESAQKTDTLDARALAEFLARDMIPEAFRPAARQRAHRAMVRHRQHLKPSVTALKNKRRRIASDDNADRKDRFTADGWKGLEAVRLSGADRFVLDQWHAGWRHLEGPLKAPAVRLQEFAAAAPAKEAEARAKLATIPGVGPVTVDVVVGELGDVTRFHSVKAACAYAGPVPAVRQVGGKGKDLGITQTGSPLLRWALVAAAWRVVRQGAAWRRVYDGIKKKAGGKEAIVAVARRRLVVMAARLRDGTHSNFLKVGEACPTWPARRGPRGHGGGLDIDEGAKKPGGALAGVTTTGRPRNDARWRPHRRPSARWMAASLGFEFPGGVLHGRPRRDG